MRVLTLADGLSASVAPTSGTLFTLPAYVNDAAFVAANGAAAQGNIYLNTTTGLLRIYDGATWQNVITDNGIATLTNKKYSGGTASASRLIVVPSDTFANISALTRIAGAFYYATDRQKFYGDNGTSLTTVGSGGGGSPVIWRLPGGNSPVESYVGGIRVFDFNYTDAQEIEATLTVPADYLAGTQIFLTGAAFAVSVASGKVKFKATTYLLKSGTAVLGTNGVGYDSTNAEVSAAAIVSTQTDVGNIDATSASGQINAVAVSPGDRLLTKLIRDTTNESSSSQADARFYADVTVPKYS